MKKILRPVVRERQGNTIRPIALAVIRREDELLVFKATEAIENGKEFYRSLGGGVEFGETSEEALTREIKEEINRDVKNIKVIKVLENIFTYENIEMHELVFLCEAEFTNQADYKVEEFDILDSKEGRKAKWVNVQKLKEANFFPDGIKELI